MTRHQDITSLPSDDVLVWIEGPKGLKSQAMSSRKRRPNWTDQECYLLAQLVHERKVIIRGKCITGLYDKRQAWDEITHTINSAFPQMQRTVSDCSKKWENLLAKSREEIKRQKMQTDDNLSLDQFSALTQIVISVMNPSVLQQDEEDSQPFELVESQQNSGTKDGNMFTGEQFKAKHEQTQLELPAYAGDQSTTAVGQKRTSFSNISKQLPVQFSPHHPAASGEQSNSNCFPCTHVAHCTTSQERMDLEVSVLRRQEAVLKLQEEYYTLKIHRLKKQMAESPLQD
ncbi:uncharacterized protein LOC133507649 isoform X2 [Syngnathoides biaculeatus]|uniref:uncharacterized protein LOC133507649 isoform X2 n=1 Tax=Syngnathoides biaculeatus TaxID=300417 RepID=UPI002ADD399D|nr:uncharacterized protein LOC133507649 isoform X2 [Syngnathoides biaculeatus]